MKERKKQPTQNNKRLRVLLSSQSIKTSRGRNERGDGNVIVNCITVTE